MGALRRRSTGCAFCCDRCTDRPLWPEIGILLSSLGLLFTFLGVLFLFDRGLLAIGNVRALPPPRLGWSAECRGQLLFLTGGALVIGLKKTGAFFFQRRKLRGTIPFAVGMVLVLIGWAKIGILIEAFGFVNLFGCVSVSPPAPSLP